MSDVLLGPADEPQHSGASPLSELLALTADPDTPPWARTMARNALRGTLVGVDANPEVRRPLGGGHRRRIRSRRSLCTCRARADEDGGR